VEAWPDMKHYETTDPDLLDALRTTGNEQAWDRFVEEYRGPILRHCRSMGLTSDQAEEVLQECLIKCSTYLPTFEYRAAVGRFRAWLNLTVNQRIGEVFRRSIRSERVKEAYRGLLLELGENLAEPYPPPCAFDYELLSMAFRQTQTEVDPRHWQIFEAYVVHGLRSAEVARQFEVTAIAVRVTCHRVRGVLFRNWRLIQDGPF
jgi:RNA polymerase sigma factor (sigma-70 family)